MPKGVHSSPRGGAVYGDTPYAKAIREKGEALITISDLAKHTGIAMPQLKRYINGQGAIPLVSAKRMADRLGLTLDEFHYCYINRKIVAIMTDPQAKFRLRQDGHLDASIEEQIDQILEEFNPIAEA